MESTFTRLRNFRIDNQHEKASRVALVALSHPLVRENIQLRCKVALELGHAAYRLSPTLSAYEAIQRTARCALESIVLHPAFEAKAKSVDGKDAKTTIDKAERDRVLNFLYWLLPGVVLASSSSPARVRDALSFMPLMPRTIRDKYRPLNPSIQRVSRGYIVNVRTVNFERNANCTRYESREGDGIVKTRNILLRLTRTLEPEPDEMSVDVPDNAIDYKSRRDVLGLEDARLVLANDAHKTRWLTATVYGTLSDMNTPTMFLSRLDLQGRVVFVRRLQGYMEHLCQKSWLPFFDGHQLKCVYGYHPYTVILSINTDTAHVHVSRQVAQPFNVSRFRGSGGPVFAHGCAYVMVHEVIWFGDLRIYTHRLIEFDERTWLIRRVTPSFCFRHVGVEYAAGMTLMHDNKGLIATFGFDDREAWLVCLPWTWVWNQFSYSDILLTTYQRKN